MNLKMIKCKICLEEKPLAVDHSHITDEIRGLLCRQCNTALGLLKENPDILKSALEYISVPILRSSVTPVILVLNDIYWLPYVLESIDGWFDRMVVYDAGSNDGTSEFLQEFIKDSQSEIHLELFPRVEPKAQLAFRNAAIADAGTKYYMIIDGDEIWPESSLIKLEEEFSTFVKSGKLYGVVNRTEICASLKEAYSPNEWLPHHRLYHRNCTWRGTHPGEYATIKQRPSNEYNFSNEVEVFHFHHPARSPQDYFAYRRDKRKLQNSYCRGTRESINLLEEVPILRKKISGYPINPELERLQDAFIKV